MASWFWLNVPLMVLVFLAVSGIPLWLVLRHPDRGPEHDQRHAHAAALPAAATETAAATELVAVEAAPPIGLGERDESLVPSLIACPECGLPGEVLELFSLVSTEGPVDHIAVSCVDGHHFRMAVDSLPVQTQAQLRSGQVVTSGLKSTGLAVSRMPGRMGTVGATVTDSSRDGVPSKPAATRP